MADADLVTPGFVRDPYPLLAELREREPVYWSDSVGGWLLTRYDDIVATFKDPERFSNERRLGQAVAYLPDAARARFAPFEAHYRTKGLLHSDPPDHTRLRKLEEGADPDALEEQFGGMDGGEGGGMDDPYGEGPMGGEQPAKDPKEAKHRFRVRRRAPARDPKLYDYE